MIKSKKVNTNPTKKTTSFPKTIKEAEALEKRISKTNAKNIGKSYTNTRRNKVIGK